MGEMAKKKLFTSKGVILSGHELPDDLPAKELDAIRAAGGLEDQRSSAKRGKSSRSTKGGKSADAKADELAAAEAAVEAARAKIEAAGNDLAKKAEAERELSDAEAELAQLES